MFALWLDVHQWHINSHGILLPIKDVEVLTLHQLILVPGDVQVRMYMILISFHKPQLN
jgi:hypothetical protein